MLKTIVKLYGQHNTVQCFINYFDYSRSNINDTYARNDCNNNYIK